jgi:hypothetical protein
MLSTSDYATAKPSGAPKGRSLGKYHNRTAPSASWHVSGQRRSSTPRTDRTFCYRNDLFLTPVAFHQHPSGVAVLSVMGDPMSVRAWRTVPSPRYPYIGMTIPTMVAGHPNVIATGAYRMSLNNGMWRLDRHDDFFGGA